MTLDELITLADSLGMSHERTDRGVILSAFAANGAKIKGELCTTQRDTVASVGRIITESSRRVGPFKK